MTCAERREALIAYLDGELAPAERTELETHLAGCVACREALAAERGLSGQLAALPPVVPSGGFEARFWARIARDQPAQPGGLRAWLGRLLGPRGLIAAGGLGVAVLAAVLVRTPNPPERDVDFQIAADPEAFELLQDPDLDVAEVADLLQKMDRQGGPERGPG